MSLRRSHASALFAALILNSPASAQEYEDENLLVPESKEGQGVVMEFERNDSEDTVSKNKTKAQTGVSEIDFIIGGQGEDGIAKRRVLKVDD